MWLEKSFIRVYHKTQNQNKRRRKSSQHKTLLLLRNWINVKCNFQKKIHVTRALTCARTDLGEYWRAWRLTAVQRGHGALHLEHRNLAVRRSCCCRDIHMYISASVRAVFLTRGEGWDRAWTSVERWGRASGVFGEDERIVRDIEVVFFWTLECDQKAKGGAVKGTWLAENRPSSHLDDISDLGANKKGIRKQNRQKQIYTNDTDEKCLKSCQAHRWRRAGWWKQSSKVINCRNV